MLVYSNPHSVREYVISLCNRPKSQPGSSKESLTRTVGWNEAIPEILKQSWGEDDRLFLTAWGTPTGHSQRSEHQNGVPIAPSLLLVNAGGFP